jgi:hypothetical protein
MRVSKASTSETEETLRYGEVQFNPATALEDIFANPPTLTGKGPDLNLRILFPATQQQFRNAERRLRNDHAKLSDGLLIAIAQPPTSITAALADLTTWKWVRENTPALAGDRYAREEVAREVARAERVFRDRLGGLDNLELPTTSALTWFSAAGAKKLKSGRELLRYLGEECDRIYNRAPRVLNELINRRYCPGADNEAMQAENVDKLANYLQIPKIAFEHPARHFLLDCFPLSTGNFYNLVLTGTAGQGKTSLCFELVQELTGRPANGSDGVEEISVATPAGQGAVRNAVGIQWRVLR